MTATLSEQRLGDLRWIVARGSSTDVFHALGVRLRAAIIAYLADTPLLPRLRRHVATEPGARRLAAVRDAGRVRCPRAWAELAALADGAGAAVDDLLLLNLRGDLGRLDGPYGCSDLAWRRDTSVIAHNEDGDVADLGHCLLLTLATDEAPAVTAFWYPVFLPGNAITVTEHSLVWTIDSLTVEQPAAHPGRHFVARDLQRRAGTLDQAIGYLGSHPSAGGFAYNLGDRSGRVVSMDTAAGRHESVEVGAHRRSGPLVWHTNHPRYLPATGFRHSDSSTRRGAVLDALVGPAGEPGVDWFLHHLGSPHPRGVHVRPSAADRGATLCTFVADLTAGEAVIAVPGGEPVVIPLPDLATGEASRQRLLARPPAGDR